MLSDLQIYFGVALVLAHRQVPARLLVAACFVGGVALMPLWVLNSTWVL